MALYFHLHNVSCLPLFVYIAHIEAICNEANERRKPLQYNTQQPNYERYTPPPLYRCNRKHPSSLSFFLFFSDFFSLSDCSNILSKSRCTSCNIILLSYTSYCFTLMLLYAVCVWAPFIIFIIKGRAVFAVAHFFLYVTFFFMGFGLDIFPLFI